MVARNYCVYILTCRTTGLKYVGKTNDFNRRMNEHSIGLDGETNLQQAIRDFGWSSFEYFVYMWNLTREEATNVEIQMIARLDTYLTGYNMTSGGEG